MADNKSMSEEEEEMEIVDPDEVFKKAGPTWYEVSYKHWEGQGKNVSGMLGGYPAMNAIDVTTSREIIAKYVKKGMGRGRAADCGGGIGRVSEFVLSKTFAAVDLIEYVPSLIEEAKKRVGELCEFRTICVGCQDWVPDAEYDCVWIQWVLMYLMDGDAVEFLKRCKAALKDGGYVIVRENIAHRGKGTPKTRAQYRALDNQVNRAIKHYLELFDNAGLKVIEAIPQKKWDPELLPVYTYVLQ